MTRSTFTHTQVPGVKYIAGITFQSEYGVHEAGSEVKEAEKFQNLQTLVDAKFLYPYAPEEGYAWLPPHLFSAVRTREETLKMMEGDPTGSHVKFEKTELHKQAERESEAQDVIREQMKNNLVPAEDRGPTPEEVASKATGEKIEPKEETNTGLPVVEVHEEKPVVKQTTAKKTAKKAASTKEKK